MNLIDAYPEHFPGKEFSLRWGTEENPEYIYEIDYVDYATTTSGQVLAIPDIWYRALTEVDVTQWRHPYIDSAAGKVGIELLTDSQLKALEIATHIDTLQKEESPERNTFAGIREIKRDRNGVLYITGTEEGARLQDDEPFAAVSKAKVLGFIDFATTTRGYHGFFKYDKADLEAFIPDELVGANAYMMIDEPRVVVGKNCEHDFQIARVMLLDAQSDLDFSLSSLDRTLRIITVEEDGTETVHVYDPASS